MRSCLVFVCGLIIASIGLASAARAVEKLPSYLQVGDQRLHLNGSGGRTKAYLELYTAGLYLTKPSTSPEAVIAADEPMALRIKITSSFVSRSSLVDSLDEGFKNAAGAETQALRQEIDQFREFFKAEVKKGDIFDIVYLPQHGVIVNKNGQNLGVVASAAFKRALFGIWLCNKPADAALKQALMTAPKMR